MRAALPICFCLPLLAGCASDRLSRGDHGLIRDRVLVVTGASSGFGRGVAEELDRHGGNVVLAARRGGALRQVEANGGRALAVPTDVSDAAVARLGRIDAWINNAGIGAIGAFETMPMEDRACVVDVNLKGVIFGSDLALTQFKRQGFGTLVNVGSVEGAIPLAYHNSYAAGGIHQPLPRVPATVEGGVRARMEREDAAREAAERGGSPR